MNEETYELKNLTKKDISTILECLLFSSSSDICASWYDENVKNMIELTKNIRLKHPSILTQNVYMFDPDVIKLEDEVSRDILKIFPEIKKENI